MKLELPQPVLALILIVMVLGSAFAMLVTGVDGTLLFPQAKNIFFAVLIAIGLGIGGYLKNTTPEEFDEVKFLITVIISIFVGFVMYWLGYDYTTAENVVTNILVQSGALIWIEYWLKALIRRLTEIEVKLS